MRKFILIAIMLFVSVAFAQHTEATGPIANVMVDLNSDIQKTDYIGKSFLVELTGYHTMEAVNNSIRKEKGWRVVREWGYLSDEVPISISMVTLNYSILCFLENGVVQFYITKMDF